MFYGGLNGDGFFNTAYANGGYENGEDGCGGYIAPTPLSAYQITKTGVETDKAVQLQLNAGITFWMPKSVLTRPHFDSVESWGVTILHTNLARASKVIGSTVRL